MAEKESGNGEDAGTERPLKILVIGCSGFTSVRCVEWSGIDDIQNIADFDVILVASGSLTSHVQRLREEAEAHAAADAEDAEDGRHVDEAHRLHDIQEHVKERLVRVLASKGLIIALIQPYKSANLCNEHFYRSCADNQTWLPLPITQEKEPGNTLKLMRQDLKRYFDLVQSWTHVFGRQYEKDQIGYLTARDFEPKPRAKLAAGEVALDRQGQLVSVDLHYGLYKDAGRGYEGGRTYEDTHYFTSGSLILLPPPTQATEESALSVLLEDLFGIEPKTPPPAFAQSIRLAGEDEIDKQVVSAREAVGRAEEQLERVLQSKRERRRFVALVYEKGIVGLEDVAKGAFIEMGLDVSDAEPDVSDEFYIGLGGPQALVEVRGHRKSAQLADIRQLMDHLLRYEERHGAEIKGVQLVNAWNELPLEKRDGPDTPTFPHNVVERAKKRGIALLSGVELLNALQAFWRQELTGQDLLERLLNASGPVEFQPRPRDTS